MNIVYRISIICVSFFFPLFYGHVISGRHTGSNLVTLHNATPFPATHFTITFTANTSKLTRGELFYNWVDSTVSVPDIPPGGSFTSERPKKSCVSHINGTINNRPIALTTSCATITKDLQGVPSVSFGVTAFDFTGVTAAYIVQGNNYEFFITGPHDGSDPHIIELAQ